MAIRRATQFPGAMPEEIAFGKRRTDARHASLRLNGAFFIAALISLLLVVPAVAVGWSVGRVGGAAGFGMAVAAGSLVSVFVTFLAARAWLQFGPGDRLFADATLTGWIRRGRAERQVAAAREVFDDPEVASIELHVNRLIGISQAVEARDARTHRHSNRVAIRATAAGKHLGLDREAMTRLRAAAKLHDIGALSEPVWLEPTEHEQLNVALAGAELVGFTGDRRLIAALRHQRENFDGSGSPDGLAGDAIPLTARIIAVADAYDTISRERGQTAALAELNAGSGSRFDPDVVDAFNADAHATPITALRGAAAGVAPKATAAATDLLRGTATVAAAASIATGAVVSSGVTGPLPSNDKDSNSIAPVAAAAGVAAASGSGSSSAGDSPAAKSKNQSDNENAKNIDASSPRSETKSADGTTHSAQAPSATESKSELPSVKDLPAVKKPAVPATPVDDLTEGLGETVDNTTQTVDKVVQDVGETVDNTTQQLGETVDNVVGGVVGKKK
ncbi:MAG: HD-GYP domain-containing protein [Solirubrobacterales bacterium]